MAAGGSIFYDIIATGGDNMVKGSVKANDIQVQIILSNIAVL